MNWVLHRRISPVGTRETGNIEIPEYWSVCCFQVSDASQQLTGLHWNARLSLKISRHYCRSLLARCCGAAEWVWPLSIIGQRQPSTPKVPCPLGSSYALWRVAFQRKCRRSTQHILCQRAQKVPSPTLCVLVSALDTKDAQLSGGVLRRVASA